MHLESSLEDSSKDEPEEESSKDEVSKNEGPEGNGVRHGRANNDTCQRSNNSSDNGGNAAPDDGIIDSLSHMFSRNSSSMPSMAEGPKTIPPPCAAKRRRSINVLEKQKKLPKTGRKASSEERSISVAWMGPFI